MPHCNRSKKFKMNVEYVLSTYTALLEMLLSFMQRMVIKLSLKGLWEINVPFMNLCFHTCIAEFDVWFKDNVV